MKIAQGTALNRAWASYDIVATILETLAPGPVLKPPLIYPADERLWRDQRRQNKIALSRVACVCRALSSIALDILWRNINSIFHLIHIVPSCYTLRTDSEDGIYEIRFTRVPSEDELRCLRTYAARIRELELPRARLQYDGIAMLLHWFPPPDVFILPQLRRLDWFFDGEFYKMPPDTATKLINLGNLRHFTLFLRDTLESSDPTIIDDMYPMLRVLHSFGLHSVVFPVASPVPHPPLINDESLIWHLPNLRSLDISIEFTVTRPILLSLSELSLQSLTLGHFSTSMTPRLPRLHFPTLLNLSLTAVASDVVEIMQSISSPNVTGLFLGIEILDNRDLTLRQGTAINAIFAALPPSLRRVHIRIKSNVGLGADPVYLGPNAVDFDDFVLPFQSFRNLRELMLNVRLGHRIHGFLELFDGNLRSLIPIWPELEHFEYTIRPYCGPMGRPPLPTLNTIFAFARSHPRLLHLELPYVRTDPLPQGLNDPTPQDALPPLQGHGLLWFKAAGLVNHRDPSLQPIALAFNRAFPQLRKEIQRTLPYSYHFSLNFIEIQLLRLRIEEEVHGE